MNIQQFRFVKKTFYSECCITMKLHFFDSSKVFENSQILIDVDLFYLEEK